MSFARQLAGWPLELLRREVYGGRRLQAASAPDNR